MSIYGSGSSRSSGGRPSGSASARVSGSAGAAPASGGSGHQYGGNTYGGNGSPRVPKGTDKARTVVTVCLVVCLAATLGGVGVFAYLKSLDSGFDRQDAFGGLQDRPVDEGGLNILVMGSDSRNPDSDEGSRADTMIMMHVPSDGGKAYLVSLPRDLYVDIPATDDGSWQGGKKKLNAAMSMGGIPLTVQTVEGFSNTRIDHVVEIDFEGLIEVVDALGGVNMDVQPADDGTDKLTSIHKYDGKDYRSWDAGKQKMGGEAALDYVRQRKQFAEGDFARMRHQQELLMAMMDKATSAGIITKPSTLQKFVASTIDTVKVDEDFEVNGVLGQVYDLRSDDLVFMTSPNVGSQNIEGESVVVPDDELSGSMYKSMAADDMNAWFKENPDAVKGGASE